jgi:hypothetical protein
MTAEVIAKLQEWLTLTGHVLYSCARAGISKDAYYDHRKKDKKFSDEMDACIADTFALACKSERELIEEKNPQIVSSYLKAKDDTRKDRVESNTNLIVKGLTEAEALELDIEELEKIANQ